ncbi:ethanolamine ammonia-lyase subunit EutC [Zhenpiania hominis]|uniref:Ethanolamine ammonia-lyase small subunit n=1 Tax=Zhenpiania hominis TaxID=2763644 RepID=A0A923NNC7_9FIRM|nr:ethanolamine ammonia-lyase subunit EutC [Zhenpiania hominis]MBC6681141.1 ethanolamine ammonia-lyase subunit EutC [Zhenpiania hominis]
MNKTELIDRITTEILKILAERAGTENHIQSPDMSFLDDDMVEQMKKKTSARIGVGKAGPRLRTGTLLKLRADHASAKDAVLCSVDEHVLKELGLFQVQSKCRTIEEHLTRPDLGRQLSEEAVQTLSDKCVKNPRVQIYVSDGLSNMAVESNAGDLLPVMIEGLKDRGIETGTPFFLKYGRVPTMDSISELLNAELTCALIGERPGLAAADSMSAYITYKARVGIPESKRTVISNIHENGIQPVEAGAYAVDIICQALEEQATGVDLRR